MRLYFLRHGITAWNVEKRIQGRTDIQLTEKACQALKAQHLSAKWLSYNWVSSPLVRAEQTACLLGAIELQFVNALIETNWGEFEGMTLHEIECEIRRLELKPDHGLDFIPPNGESPRMVRTRLADWLITLDERSKPMMIVTHKGVIRSALSLATGWSMEEQYVQKIDWTLPLEFDFAQGRLTLSRVNCSW